jgi:hypothetical protein
MKPRLQLNKDIIMQLRLSGRCSAEGEFNGFGQDSAVLARKAPLTTIRILAIVAILGIATQVASATWFVHVFRTPNASTLIAQNWLRTGAYWGGSERMWGNGHGNHIVRAFQLPGEPLFLAAMFALPEYAHKYVHVPIIAMLTCALTLVAKKWAGARVALVTGLVATFHPFVVLHGVVWDDAFLATALLWTVIAIVCYRSDRGPDRPIVLVPVAFLSGAAAVTRADCQVILLLLGATFWLLPETKATRAACVAAIAGMALALVLWGARNKVAVGSFVVGTTHDGITLWESNGPYSREAVWKGQVEAVSYSFSTMAQHWARTAGMNEVQADAYFRHEAISYIVRHPVTVFQTGLLKVFFSLLGIRPNESWHNLRNGVSLLANLAVLLFVFLGFWHPPRQEQLSWRRPRLILCLTITGAVGALLALGPIGFRYCMPLEGLLWMFAGQGVVYVIENRREPDASLGMVELQPRVLESSHQSIGSSG